MLHMPRAPFIERCVRRHPVPLVPFPVHSRFFHDV